MSGVDSSGANGIPETERLSRRGYRLMIVSALLSPVLVILWVIALIGIDYCGELFDSAANGCSPWWAVGAWLLGLVLLADASAFFYGLVLRLRTRRTSTGRAVPSGEPQEGGRSSRRSSHARWSIVLGALSVLLLLWGRSFGGVEERMHWILVWPVSAAAAIVGWRALDPRSGHQVDRRTRRQAFVGAGLGIASVLGTVVIAAVSPLF